ncbi:MAG: hypothetical protein GC136_00045 [Alphaproteobacteria bacterium]|nr:hypothetical protein [Alphaproteobacteria bacterium]
MDSTNDPATALYEIAETALSKGVGNERYRKIPAVLSDTIGRLALAGVEIRMSFTGDESLTRLMSIMQTDPSRLHGADGYLADRDLECAAAALENPDRLGLQICISLPKTGDLRVGAGENLRTYFGNANSFSILVSPEGKVSYSEEGLPKRISEAQKSATRWAFLGRNAAAAKGAAQALESTWASKPAPAI